MSRSTVHVVVPAGIDDPARPSGGNRYDRRLCTGLTAAGWAVRERHVAGLQALAAEVATVPDGGLLLVDGLVASAAPAVLVPESRRLRLVVLVHMPLGDVEVPADDERAVLTSARAVVATSDWTRSRLLERYGLDVGRVGVARPGADRREATEPRPAGERLLCVGALTPHKGQDVLVEALAGLRKIPWRCTVAGPLDRHESFVARLRGQIRGLEDRVLVKGPSDADQLYADADLLVLPSRLEAYGMVVTEALAAGIPVVASAVGGVPEAMGTTSLGQPGLLVPPGDPAALRGAITRWLGEPDLRRRLRAAAAERRQGLTDWTATTRQVAALLARVGTEPERMLARGPR